MTKPYELGYELMPHSPYSLDLVTIDYYLFLNQMTWIGGKRYDFNNEIIDQTYVEIKDF